MKWFVFFLVSVFLIGLIGCASDNNDPVSAGIDSPTNLTAEAQSGGVIILSWTDRSSGTSGFIVQRSIGTDGEWSGLAEVDPGTNSYTDNGLSEGTLYNYRLKAVLGGESSDFTDAVSATTFPLAPEDLQAIVSGGTVIDLSWSDESNAEDGYLLERKAGAGVEFETLDLLAPDLEFYQDTDVVVDQTYFYRLRATLGEISSEWSEEVSVALVMGPTNLTAETVSDNQISLTWEDNSSVETGFRVESHDESSEEWAELITTSPDDTTFDVAELSEATLYSFRVIGILELAETDPTNVVEATTPPKAPTNLAAVADVEAASITLTWSDQSDAEDRFELQSKMEGEDNFTGFTNPAADVEIFVDTGKELNTTYYYRIRAVTVGNIASAWSAEVGVTTTVLTPDPPTELTASNLTYYSVDLTWNDNSDNELGFKLERSTMRFEGFVEIGSLTADQNSFSDEGLEPDWDYYYRILAYNDEGNSPYASVLLVHTAEGPPLAPINLRVTDNHYAHVTLGWDMPEDNNDERVVIERRVTSDGEWTEVGSVDTAFSQYMDETTEQLSTYFYRVYATNYVGVSPYTDEVEVNTPLAPPNAPSSLDTTGLTYLHVDLEWVDNSDDETGFRVYRISRPVRSLIATLDANVTEFINDSDVEGLATYTYVVTAFNDAGDSDDSNMLTITLPPEPPEAPYGLRIEAPELTVLELRWTTDDATEDSFNVERKDNLNGEFRYIGSAPQFEYFYKDEDLTPDGHEYWYRIQAVNAGGISDYSEELSGQTPDFNPPTDLTVTAYGLSEIISWDPGPYWIETFILERKDEENGEFAHLADVEGATSYMDSDLEADAHPYWYRVKSVVYDWESDWSDEVYVETPFRITLEDFEDYDVDAEPDGNWSVFQQQGETFAIITDTVSHGDDQSLHFVDPANADYLLLQWSHDGIPFGELSFWLNLTQEGAWGFRGVSGGGNPGTDVEYLLYFLPDGSYASNDGNQYAYPAGSWSDLEGWFEVRSTWDEDRFSIWVDDVPIVDNYLKVAGRPLASIVIYLFSDTVMENAWMDDIRLEVLENEANAVGPSRSYDRPSIHGFNFDTRSVPTGHPTD